mmetsp:Transcript_2854/g.6789  ORF Transcript_2854/g.6789 Transcript_2854/m.6789 type:complete len:241 (+) Transcript_2854:345-1067(+)
MDGLVWALEEAELAVLRKLQRRRLLAEVQALESLGGHNDGCCDVILGLKLPGGHEVLPEGEGPPCDVRVLIVLERRRGADINLGLEPYANVGRDERGLPKLDLVPPRSVDRVSVEVPTPVVAPLYLVVLLDHTEKLPDVGGDVGDKGVVLISILARGGEHAKHVRHAQLGVKQAVPIRLLQEVLHRLVAQHVAVVVVDQPLNLVKVTLDVGGEDWTEAHHVLEPLADLALAPPRHGRGLV